ncbi:FMN-binding protein, partial [Arenicella sp.]|nr:FMN-binding protein [Arenicella sp.]
MAQKMSRSRVQRLMPLYRVVVLAAIVFLARAQHAKFKTESGGVAIELVAVQQVLAGAASLGKGYPVEVFDAEGKKIGMAVRTSPASDEVVGYAGPTDTLVVFDPSGKVAGIRILESADTTEHVGEVLQDGRFMDSFTGKAWGELAALKEIDAVSGSTLTSMAIAEGIVLRVAGSRPSLRFPEDVTLEDLKKLFPEAEEFEKGKGVALREVKDGAGIVLGYFVRTSPYSDDVVGYQGPSDVLLGFDPSGKIAKFRVLKSYDNEPYVGDLRYEPAFFKVFTGMSLAEVAKIVPEEEGIEGVSGSTMTSWAVAQSVVERAKALNAAQASPVKFERKVSVHEWGTIGVLLFGCL